MLKITTKILKKLIFAFILIYSLDLILNSVNIFIPINIFTLSVGTILGPSGIIAIIMLQLII